MSRRLRFCAILALFLAPLALMVPALMPGQTFLPMHTFQDAPLTLWEEDVELRRSFAGPAQKWNGDVVDKLYPIYTDVYAMQRDGMLWSNRWCGGAPLLAQGLAGFLYPPNLLFQCCDPLDVYGILAWLSLSLGALFAWLFLRSLALHPLACILGGLSFGLSLYTAANLHYYMRVDAAIWLPLALLAIRRRAQGGSAAWHLLLATALGLSFLAGFPQISFFVAYASGIYALWCSVRVARSTNRKNAAYFFATTLACIALGICLAGAQLLPQREASDQSLRDASSSLDPRVAWDSVDRWRDAAMEPGCLATAFAPYLLGSPSDALQLDDPMPWLLLDRPFRERHTNQAAGYNFTENQLYFGILPLLAALLALLLRPKQSLGPLVALAATLCFAMALLPSGIFGLPFQAVYSLPFAQVGAPGRVLAVGLFFAAWLAALGFDAVIRGAWRERITAAGLLLAAIIGTAIAWSASAPAAITAEVAPALISRAEQGEERAPRFDATVENYAEDGVLSRSELDRVSRRVRADFERAWILAIIGLVALALLTLAARPAAAGLVLMLAVAGDLVIVGREPNHPIPRATLFARPPPVASLSQVIAAEGLAPHRIARAQVDFGEVFSLLRPNLPGVYDIPDISGYIVAASKRLAEVFAALDPATRYDRWVAYLPLRLQAGEGEVQWLTHHLLDAAGIGYLLSIHPLHEHPDPIVRASVELVYRDEPPLDNAAAMPRFHIYRRTHAMPRAFLAQRLVTGKEPEDLIPLLKRADWDPREELIVLDRDLPAGVDPHAVATGSAELKITRYEPTWIEIEKRGAGSGWAYLSDVYWPGWIATVDGEEREIVPANHAFRAVWMNEKEERLVMRYQPSSLRHGIWLAVLAAIALLLIAWRSRRVI